MQRFSSLSLMLALIVMLVPLAAMAVTHGSVPVALAGRTRGIADAGFTGLVVQNLDPVHHAELATVFFRQDGADPVRVPSPLLSPQTASLIYPPLVPELASGLYGAWITSDRDIAAVVRTDWPATGAAAAYGSLWPDTEVVVPLVMKQYHGQCSIVSIQNSDRDADAIVHVEVFQHGAQGPVANVWRLVPPGTSTTERLCHQDSYAIMPDGLLGSMRVTSDTPIGVQSFVDIRTSARAVHAFAGVPISEAAVALYAPLIRRRQPFAPTDPDTMHYDTGIAVANPNDGPVEITVTYHGAKGGAACVGRTFVEGPVEIGAHSTAILYQGPGGSWSGPSPLPDGCVASARITSEGGGVLAVVGDALDLTVESAAYNAIPADRAGRVVGLPLFRSNHTPWRLYTGVAAMNVGAAAADMTLVATSQEAAGEAPAVATRLGVAPYEVALFWPGDFATEGAWADPRRSFGSAVITSTQPIAVIVNDISLAGVTDATLFVGAAAGGTSRDDDLAAPFVCLDCWLPGWDQP